MQGRCKAKKQKTFIKDSYDMSQHIPYDKCPDCGNKNLKKIDELSSNSKNLTEGEIAEYFAGNWGTVKCLKCGKIMKYSE